MARAVVVILVGLLSAWAQAGERLVWQRETLREVYAPGDGFYCYAPSVIEEGGVTHVWACRNAVANVIRDHVVYLRGDEPGKANVVLGPNEKGAWDSFHVCDPSVVKGEFSLGGKAYRYAMFYLGNDVDASANNQIGVAFANEYAGPWVRAGRPIVTEPAGHWGVGQASAVSVDRKGKVMLFYTRGNGAGTYGYVCEVDLTEGDRPVVGEETRLSNRGLVGSDGRGSGLNNFDVVLDEARGRYLVVREQHPHPATEPRFIGESVQVAAMKVEDVRKPEAVWTVLGDLTPGVTGIARNHNAGFGRDAYGRLPAGEGLKIVFASSEEGAALRGRFAAFTYRLYEIGAKLVVD